MSDLLPPIVVVGYNRPKSLARLLKSLSKATYPNKPILLIISIDYSENNYDVLKVAEIFQWDFGEKKVIQHDTNLGLRKHIITCSSIAMEYGSVIVLEDDLYVSPCFYHYTSQALFFSSNKNYIGGVSLYNHQLNVHTGANFSPIEDGYDNWYFQFASSWGQAYTGNQFNLFLSWYTGNPQIASRNDVPNYVKSWSDKSWLKYYITYLVDTNKYFLYPKISLSTNYGEQGTHMGSTSTMFQVPLMWSHQRKYVFSTLEESLSVYDAFYENLKLHKYLNLSKDDLCVDLYGYRMKYITKYILTPKILKYKIIGSYGRSLRPLDANIIEHLSGDDFYLYDTNSISLNTNKRNRLKEIIYDKKTINYKEAIFLMRKLIFQRILLLLKNLIKG